MNRNVEVLSSNTIVDLIRLDVIKDFHMCSVGLESECPGMEKIEGELFFPREKFSFSEIGQSSKPSVARFWKSRSRKRKISIEERKVSLRFFSFQDHSLFSPTDAFFLSVGLRQTIRLVGIPDATYGCPLI